jgi:hypothetical protein
MFLFYYFAFEFEFLKQKIKWRQTVMLGLNYELAIAWEL